MGGFSSFSVSISGSSPEGIFGSIPVHRNIFLRNLSIINLRPGKDYIAFCDYRSETDNAIVWVNPFSPKRKLNMRYIPGAMLVTSPEMSRDAEMNSQEIISHRSSPEEKKKGTHASREGDKLGYGEKFLHPIPLPFPSESFPVSFSPGKSIFV